MRKEFEMINSDIEVNTKGCERLRLSVRCSFMLKENHYKYSRDVYYTGREIDLYSLQPKVKFCEIYSKTKCDCSLEVLSQFRQ